MASVMPNPLGIPNPNGCRYCAVDERGHAQVWWPGIGWHNWVAPTDVQRLARMKARRRRK